MHQGPEQRSAARIRGVAAGAVSASLAVAAHGVGGGGLPEANGALLLLGVCLLIAALGCCAPPLRHPRIGLFALLSVGQLAGHEVLAMTGHAHGGASTGMLGAHAVTVGLSAVLVALAERVGPRCAAVLRRVLTLLAVFEPEDARRPVLGYRVLGPRRVAVPTGSISRRGPPLAV